MQSFLHAICSACTLDFHFYATKMPYMYSYCCYRREKKEYSTKKCSARQKVTKLLRKLSNSIIRISFLVQNLVCVSLLTVRGADFLEACLEPWACSVQRAMFWALGLESQEWFQLVSSTHASPRLIRCDRRPDHDWPDL